MPVSSGRCLSNSVNASSPPAEAPTPTIGNGAPTVAEIDVLELAFTQVAYAGHGGTLWRCSVGRIVHAETSGGILRRPSISAPRGESHHDTKPPRLINTPAALGSGTA